jgi:peptide/nickel transport system ATP-binding protein
MTNPPPAGPATIRPSIDRQPILSVENLCVEFKTRSGTARVLDGVDLTLAQGETLGIVGESGCGKSMTALSIMRLVPSPPGRIVAGTISLRGEPLLAASDHRMRQLRGNRISMIFQEPMTSLNPVFTIGDQIAEAVRLHEPVSRREAQARAVDMLKAVRLPDPGQRVHDYPHQLSGGMRQRVMIAMALACKPDVLIADEPTTALDVTVQAQIFDLLSDLKRQNGTSIILITHNIGAVAEMADRVAVMYAGRKIEEGPVASVLTNPQHPYTRGLIACVPHLDSGGDADLAEIPGMVPSILKLGAGCAFAPRCAHAMDRCRVEQPATTAANAAHTVRCFLHQEAHA